MPTQSQINSQLFNRLNSLESKVDETNGYLKGVVESSGKPDVTGGAVVTNKLQNVQGAQQNNPLQVLIEKWRASAEEWRVVATNTAARVDAVAETLRAKRAEYVEKRDAAVLPTTKAIYQAFIDQIDKWLAKLEAKKED